MLQAMKPQIKHMIGGISLSAAQKSYVRQVIFNAMLQRSDDMMRLHDIEEMRFLTHVFQQLPTSNAQIFQDLWVTYETGGARARFFVEFGATNGRTNSNTLLLEEQFGWGRHSGRAEPRLASGSGTQPRLRDRASLRGWSRVAIGRIHRDR